MAPKHLTPSEVAEIVAGHDQHFDSKRSLYRECRALYLTRFWRENTYTDNVLRTEVPKAYAVVESYLGSLYAKDPSVVVGPDLRGRGNPEVAEATANQFLKSVRQQIEDATRLALIYSPGFIKLSPVESVDPMKRVQASAIPPWQIIVDDTAHSWDNQRFVGHVYMLPVKEAMQRYGKRRDAYTTRPYVKWIESASIAGQKRGESSLGIEPGQDSPYAEWVRVVEMYDLRADKLLVWSPDYKDGTKFLFTGVKVQVGALDAEVAADADSGEVETKIVHETTGIPYKTASGRPIVPIIPLYFSRDPDSPLRGYSLIERSKDQFRELNLMRTYQAQGVRRMARQWLVRAGFLSEDGAAKIASGIDGEFIEVDVVPGTPLEGNMMPVPNVPIPADIAIYAQTVSADIDAAGLLAPFTRGEVTKSTATEQNLLASYTSSEIGRMARQRDDAISLMSQTYNTLLSVVLGDDGEPLSLPNPVGPTILSADDLTGDFQYTAVDPATTPMNDLAKRSAIQNLAPLLMQLGIDPKQVLAEIVRTFQLPESFLIPPEPEPEPEAPEGAPMAPPTQTPEGL
tara:strand:+ start:2429 stop:4138 length:1710 start_codon:yes stop_codon:yes gene_type:complete